MKNGKYKYKGEHSWYKDDKLHRDRNLPAFWYYRDGKIAYKAWYKNGLRHREDGPARMWFGPRDPCLDQWFINGENITKEIEKWTKENNYPYWFYWDKAIKLHFKLMFVN